MPKLTYHSRSRYLGSALALGFLRKNNFICLKVFFIDYSGVRCQKENQTKLIEIQCHSCLNGGTCLRLPGPSQINQHPFFACICPTS